MAAQGGHVDTVALLLDWNAEVDQQLHDGATPLFIAAQNGHVGVVVSLVDHHAVVSLSLSLPSLPLSL